MLIVLKLESQFIAELQFYLGFSPNLLPGVGTICLIEHFAEFILFVALRG